MGKLFAVVVTVITIISVASFVMHTWWLPVDISTTGLAIDRQLDETMIETGILFLAGQLLLGLFVWQASDKILREKLRYFPAVPLPWWRRRSFVVGIEILALTFLGSKAWAAINIAPAAAIRCTLTCRRSNSHFSSAMLAPTACSAASIPKR